MKAPKTKVCKTHSEDVFKYRYRKRQDAPKLKVDDVWNWKSVQNAGKPKPITEKTIFDFSLRLPSGKKISGKNSK